VPLLSATTCGERNDGRSQLAARATIARVLSQVKEEVPVADARITCINKIPRNDTHHGITHLGGNGWKWTRQQVIESIEAGSNTFYTQVNGKRADVGVVSDEHGKYLRTHADGYYNDNLLALPECIGN
jgi:hypothetical protein